MAVVANSTPAMNVYVQPGSAAIPTGTTPTNYSYFVKIDTSGQGEQVTIATANTSPRIDYIVAYVNKSQAGTTGTANNTNNVFMLADVQGTPAGSPVVPTVGQIQTAIGAANPYIILAQVSVGASVSSITNPNITDLRAYAAVKTTNLTNSYKFSAYNTGTSGLAPTTFTKISYNTKDYDTSTNFDATTNFRFTAPIAGFYKFDAAFEVTGNAGEMYGIGIYKNGTEVKRGNKFQVSSGTNTISLVASPPPLSLAANDYIEVFGYNGSAGGKTVTGGQNLTYFGGFLVSAT